MNVEIKTGIIFGGIIITGIVFLMILFTGLDELTITNQELGTKKAPNLVGIAHYLNTTPEELAKKMENKVVLYDIWTYS